MEKIKNKINRVFIFSLATLLLGEVNAAIEPDKPYLKDPKERVPSSYTEEYPKVEEGAFEAQGFGEDIPDPKKLKRKPATQQVPDKKEDKNSNSGETKDLTTVKNQEALEQELQLQRRVDVFYKGRVRLKNGAAIWATEDNGTVSPKLEITTQNQIDPDSGKIQFRVYSNYFPFIKNWELRIFTRDNNIEKEVALLKGTTDKINEIEYTYEKGKYKDGDSLYYQLKVFQEEDVFDLVEVKRINFLTRSKSQNIEQKDDLTQTGTLDDIWGGNALIKQNIPIRGSRVRVVGNNIPLDHRIRYRNQSINVDKEGKFVIEEHFPVGDHRINIEIEDTKDKVTFVVPFDVSVDGKYFFMVGLADFRVGQNELSEKVTDIAGDEYNGDIFLDGRVAFFLKGKIQGKYLITAQMDTTEGDVKEIFKGLHRKNSESLFRRLDPDRYYPVYGDNSNTYQEAPTLGKFYVKIEVDESYAMWGNANTEFNNTLFAQYNRTLYGGHIKYLSKEQTKYGENKTSIKAFASEPEVYLGHNEFIGTSGSQFILRHNDVVQGSEKIAVEIRDRNSGIMKQQVTLSPYKDYEFDYLAGRIILNQPLQSFAQGTGDITNSNGLGNDQYYLIVDYEYNPTGVDLSDVTYGGRLNQWFGDYVALGGTYVEEKRAGKTYNLSAVDTTLRLGNNTYVKVENSTTENQQTDSNFISYDGGLSFIEKPTVVTANPKKASALAVETQFLLNDFYDSNVNAVLSTWYRDLEAGFSTARRQASSDTKQYGYELEMDVSKRDFVKSQMAFEEEQGTNLEKKTFVGSYGRRFGASSKLSLEYKDESVVSSVRAEERGSLLGLKYDQNITSGFNVYVKGQTTVEQNENYADNDRIGIGTNFRISRKWEGSGEYSDGDRGEASLVGLGYNVRQNYKVYANLDRSIDNSSGPQTNGITLGQRIGFKNGIRLTSENQFQETGSESGFNELYGLDYNLNRLMSMSFSLQRGTLENAVTGDQTQKSAVSAGFTYTKDTDITASSKASFVKNEGAINNEQYLFTNSVKFKAGPSRTFYFEADYSISEEPETILPLAEYWEGNIGYAYRPVKNDRWYLLGKYTNLYDLDSRAQANARTDQKVNIFSLEGTYDLTRRWELGARIARRVGSQRLVRGEGPWVDATLSFGQLRARYHLIKKWDALLEYRVVDLKESQEIQHGSLVGIDYHLGSNFKIGVGYNFTRFNDDLTNFRFDSQGWFLNLVGKY